MRPPTPRSVSTGQLSNQVVGTSDGERPNRFDPALLREDIRSVFREVWAQRRKSVLDNNREALAP